MGFATETRRHRGPEQAEAPPSPSVFVSAYSKGVTGEGSVSADCKGLICTKIVQNARCHGSAESKGVRGAGWRRVGSREHAQTYYRSGRLSIVNLSSIV